MDPHLISRDEVLVRDLEGGPLMFCKESDELVFLMRGRGKDTMDIFTFLVFFFMAM